MSEIPVNPGAPGEPVIVHDEGQAERYLDKELVESRASLKRTQIIGILLSVFTIAYVGYLTSGFHESLQPKGAAQIATGLASQRLDDFEPQFTDYIHTEVPKMIRSAPDELIKRMPEYRENLENRVVAEIQSQSEKGSAQLSKDLDEFLTAHKDQVGAMIKNGQDPAAVDAMGADMEKEFRTFLDEQKIGDTTISEKLDETLKTLKQVSDRTSKLEKNVGLTDSEKAARHAIGMLMHRIKNAQAAEPDAIKPIDVEGIKNAANQATQSLRDHMGDATSSTPETSPTTAAPATGGTAPAKPAAPASGTATAPKRP